MKAACDTSLKNSNNDPYGVGATYSEDLDAAPMIMVGVVQDKQSSLENTDNEIGEKRNSREGMRRKEARRKRNICKKLYFFQGIGILAAMYDELANTSSYKILGLN